jgi:carboxyl-terminal processing protease
LKKKFGYIYLPRFYHDFNRAAGRNAGDDVQKEIRKLAAVGVEGMILDLRGNGGGALDDAVKLSGLFIEKGPVVQVKDRQSAPQVYDDRDGDISYSGPLVVLVNSLSASASEIVAAALQDYQRAVIIGDQTFGKGTVQVMLDLDRFLAADMGRLRPLGAITLTVQKYYRITGASTQYHGVAPDIVLPDLYDYLDLSEKNQENSLPWDTVSRLSFPPWKGPFPDLAELKKRSQQRLAANDRFREITENIARLKKQRQTTLVTLNIRKFQAEQEALFAAAEKFSQKQVEFPNIRASLSEESGAGAPAVDPEKRKEWLTGLRKDPVVEEAIQVLNDWQLLAAVR